MPARKSKKTIAPHKAAGKRKCSACGTWHSKSVHRSHGKGSAARRLGTKYAVSYSKKGKPKKRRIKVKY